MASIQPPPIAAQAPPCAVHPRPRPPPLCSPPRSIAAAKAVSQFSYVERKAEGRRRQSFQVSLSSTAAHSVSCSSAISCCNNFYLLSGATTKPLCTMPLADAMMAADLLCNDDTIRD